MTSRDDLMRFATRDWAAIEVSKVRHWIRRKGELSPAALLQISDALRQHARAVRPDWPSPGERAADEDTHRRVGEALRAVPRSAR